MQKNPFGGFQVYLIENVILIRILKLKLKITIHKKISLWKEFIKGI